MQRVITGKYLSVQYIVSYYTGIYIKKIHAYVYHKYSDTLNTFDMLCPLNKAKVITLVNLYADLVVFTRIAGTS